MEKQKNFMTVLMLFLWENHSLERGGQNPLEPARQGAAVLHGPNIDNFSDIYKLLNLENYSQS